MRESRRLVAIVAADVFGYSRLVGLDEEGTLRALRDHRREFIDPLIEENFGRIANTAGDSLMIEFPSVVDAVRCATEMQIGMAARTMDVDLDRRIILRIGINVGDVVAHDGDVFGDSVNIAARLEGICEPGGVMLSDDAHRQVRDRLDLVWCDTGDHEVKNIARPVRAWEWLPDGFESVKSLSGGRANSYKPSIAVLPFDNMSGEADQEYFSDGLTEDVITALSKSRWLFVIARNSSFTYRGQAVNIKQVGDELGVRYVLEGSVRRSGDQVRITAQLIEAETGNHIWAERYDRSLTDVFEVQDEITTRIVTALDPAIHSFETHEALSKKPASLQAWDHVLRALWHINQYRKQQNLEARAELERAIELDSNYAKALAWLASTYVYDVMFNWTEDSAASLEMAHRLAMKARALDEQDSFCHVVLAAQCFWTRHLAQGRRSAERAIELQPSSFAGYYILGGILNYLGESAESVRASETALQLSPNDPVAWHCMGSLAHAHYNLEQYDEAIGIADRAIATRQGYVFGRVIKAAALGQLERTEQARNALDDIIERLPGFSAAAFDYYPFEIESQRQHLIDGLGKAGLQDHPVKNDNQ